MTEPIAFDRFELRHDDRLLLRDGEPVELRAKAFDVLAVLVERAGRLVTKSELLDRVWPGLVVEENNIASQVAALRKVIGGELVATVPGRGYRFVGALRQAGGAPADATPPTDAAPAAPRLFGRDDDLRAVHAALAAGGCVTVTGPGGVGKTVLARAVAAGHGAGRVAWVDLAALGDAAQVPGAVGRALGMAAPPASGADDAAVAGLVAALRGGGRLLLLDNAEHLVDAVAALCARIGTALPELPILVTSQLPLRIAGERVHALEPLALPGEAWSGEEALASGSVQMLVERIRALDARFPVDAAALPLLRALCARLDGLPLAIEMAASLVPLLGLGGVLDALAHRFDALRRGRRDAPGRHRTLRAALEWSHALLAPAEQRALRRLAVFAGDFSLELAVAVTADPGEDRWDAVDAFSALVDRSLVASSHTDPPRYRLLETVRSFALEMLDAAPGREGGPRDDAGPEGDAAATRRRAVRALTATLAAAVPGPTAPAAAELGNVPEALQWALAHDRSAALDLALAAAAVATWTPWLAEAARWVESCEPLLGAGLAPAREAAWWRELARFQTFVRGPRTVEAARRAAAIERERGDAEGLFWSLVPLLRSRLLEPDEFEAGRREAEALLDAHPGWPARSRAVFAGSLAMEYRRRGDFATALVHQQAELDQALRAGLAALARNARSNLAATLNGLGRHDAALAVLAAPADAPSAAADAAADDPVDAHDGVQRLNALIGLGRLADAAALAPEALARGRRFDVLDVVQVLASLQAMRGRPRAAALALGHHRQRLRARGAEPPDEDHAPWRAAERRVEAALGADVARALAERGAGLSAEAIDARLLAEQDDDDREPAHDGRPAAP